MSKDVEKQHERWPVARLKPEGGKPQLGHLREDRMGPRLTSQRQGDEICNPLARGRERVNLRRVLGVSGPGG